MNQQKLNLDEENSNESDLISGLGKFSLRPPSSSFGLTPMMIQYIKIKEKHENDILFYRMGDFYEMFFEDALKVSSILEITLTQRGEWQGKKIPMCGVPYHSAEGYIAKLIDLGHKVAICEQKDSGLKAKTDKGPMHREVVRVVTPGTVVDENLVVSGQNNFLASWTKLNDQEAISWIDLTTGEFFVESFNLEFSKNTENILERINPKEIIIPERLRDHSLELGKICISFQADVLFDPKICHERIKDFYKLKSIESFGNFENVSLSASGALIGYINLTQIGQKPLLHNLKKWNKKQSLEIDTATRRSLELMKTQNGETKGSLFNSINKTLTSGGRRLLAQRLNAPLISTNKIQKRLNTIQFMIENSELIDKLREILRTVSDMPRALARLQLSRGGPRDLASIMEGMFSIFRIKDILDSYKDKKLSKEIKELCFDLNLKRQLATTLKKALSDDLPIMTRDGNFIRNGFSQELDQIRSYRDQSKNHIVSLQKEYIEITGIQSLKIKHNNVLGYHIEIRTIHEKKIKEINQFIHRQTTAQASRYTTIELSELQKQLISSNEKFLVLENQIFEELKFKCLERYADLTKSSMAISKLDVSLSNAVLALQWNYCCPIITNNKEIEIIKGRHPVVEQSVFERFDSKFISNDSSLNKHKFLWLITGPNMAGKSTFLRQNALICILAQMGSFVPAEMAKIGIADRIFSRVGSGDDLSKGESTFMVEMVETATILNQATDKSIVILDEIGRGTSTWDGFSLAWAIVENLHNIVKSRTFFATHFHELTDLESKLSNMSLYNVEIEEINDEIIFLHKVKKGIAKKSYGVQVAKLAGIPKEVLSRANEILLGIEKKNNPINNVDERLIRHEKNKQPIEKHSLIIEEIKKIEPDKTSPIKALEILYMLKSMMVKNNKAK